MTTATYTHDRRKALEAAIARELSPAQRTMVIELVCAQRPDGSAPKVEDIMYFLRLNMPTAVARIEARLHPND